MKKIYILAVFALVLIICLYPYYKVWREQMNGKAEYARAEYNRQIKILEADAEKVSATKLAEADTIRATGRAISNRILSRSLKDSENYLYYLWLENLEKKEGDVIYIPTEGNFPVMEASRFLKKQPGAASDHP